MLKLRYNANTSIPVEVEGLTPTVAAGKSPAELERFEIFHGNRKVPLAECFSVSGDASDLKMEFEGDLSGVHWIGAQMTDGDITIRGNAGRHVGSEMSGGTIHVYGNAGGWVGAEMHGGLLHVHGNAEHLVGAAYRGSAKGMTAGTILVDGSAGNEVGHTMRRGLIAIGGSCGDFVGFNMIAGTILVFGDCGNRPAASMRRGTVGLFGAVPPVLLNTFFRSGSGRPLILTLLFRELEAHAFNVPKECWSAAYHTYSGDHVTIGRGELLVRAAA